MCRSTKSFAKAKTFLAEDFFSPSFTFSFKTNISFNGVSDCGAFRKACLVFVHAHKLADHYSSISGALGAVCRGPICEVRSATIGSMRMGGNKKADLRKKKKRGGGGMKMNNE